MFGTFWFCVNLILVGILHDGDAYGNKALDGQFNYNVFINTGRSECAGAVLDEFHILVAAHCMEGVRVDRIVVIAGVANLYTIGSMYHFVKKIYVHPGYIYGNALRVSGVESNFDIAVMTLMEPLLLGCNITSVNLPSNNYLPYGEIIDYSGWRRDNLGHFELRFADLQILWPIPDTPYKENEFFVHPRIGSGGSYNGYASGGNLIVKENILYGIASSELSIKDTSLIAVVCTEVSRHLGFIEVAMNDVNDPDNC